MTDVILNIKQWGNNLGVRLPLAVAREAHLKCSSKRALNCDRWSNYSIALSQPSILNIMLQPPLVQPVS